MPNTDITNPDNSPSIVLHKLSNGRTVTMRANKEITTNVLIYIPLQQNGNSYSGEDPEIVKLVTDEEVDSRVSYWADHYTDKKVYHWIQQHYDELVGNPVKLLIQEHKNEVYTLLGTDSEHSVKNLTTGEKANIITAINWLKTERDTTNAAAAVIRNDLTTETKERKEAVANLQEQINRMLDLFDQNSTDDVHGTISNMESDLTKIRTALMDVSDFLSSRNEYTGLTGTGSVNSTLVSNAYDKGTFEPIGSDQDTTEILKYYLGYVLKHGANTYPGDTQELVREILLKNLDMATYYNRTNKLDYFIQFLLRSVKGLALAAARAVPVGTIIAVPRGSNNKSSIHMNYLLCNGGLYNKSSYPNLWTYLTDGGNSSSPFYYNSNQFYVPNLEDATTYWNRNDSIGRRVNWSVPDFTGYFAVWRGPDYRTQSNYQWFGKGSNRVTNTSKYSNYWAEMGHYQLALSNQPSYNGKTNSSSSSAYIKPNHLNCCFYIRF